MPSNLNIQQSMGINKSLAKTSEERKMEASLKRKKKRGIPPTRKTQNEQRKIEK